MVKVFFLLVFLVAASSEAASFYHRLRESGKEIYWLKLLHYKKSWTGRYIGLADGLDFFFHPEGKHNPQAELEATINALENSQKNVGRFKQHAQCAFPERYRFLKEIGLVQAPPVICNDFEQWKKGIDSKSVTLVFSTSYPNNPSSLFGHTFMRFNKVKKKNDLLDYGVSYSAMAYQDDWGPVYAFKGIFGGYKGYFDFMPYYMKVNEYNNSESRDIYEYDLNIPAERVEKIINHLWEIYSTTYFDYFFLDENCSYLLAEVIEVGMPGWNLTDVYRWYYLPSDLVKKIKEIDYSIKSIHFRPSLKKQLSYKINFLSHREKIQFHSVRLGKTKAQQINSIQVLDALMFYYNFRKHQQKGKLKEDDHQIFRAVLLRRSRLPKGTSINNEKNFSKKNQPDISHGPSKVTWSLENRERHIVAGTHFKFGYQDLMSSDLGLEPFSQIDFFELGLEYIEGHTIDISHVGIINITSLHPYSFFDPQLSWKAGGNYKSIFDLESCFNCHKLEGYGGGGFTFNVISSWSLFYVIIGGFTEISKHLGKSFRIGPFGELSFLMSPVDFYKFQLRSQVRSDVKRKLLKEYYLTTEVIQSFFWYTNWELRIKSSFTSKYGSFKRNIYSHMGQLGYYF